MLQKYEKEGIKAGLLILFMCFGMLAHARKDTVNTWYKERYMDNDNWLYFQDIALERGLYTATVSSDNLSDGLITSLYGSYFLNNIFGFRSGVSLITDLNSDSPYLKIPCLFAIRSRTFRISYDESDNFRDFWRNLFWNIMSAIPARFEINMGPSLGYIWDNQRSLAFSIDGNLRMGLQFWRIGIYGNMGLSYLCTKNFVDGNFMAKKRIRPAMFANISGGVSFRF